MRGAPQQDEAHILHARRYREHSLLVETITRQHGRIAFVARGQAAGRRNRRESLQPFRPFLLVWRGHGELSTLNHWEALTTPPPLTGDRLISGLYLNELVIRLSSRGDGDERLYALYADTLRHLQADTPLEPLLRGFEVRLLGICGYALELETVADTLAEVTPDRRYHYEFESGPLTDATGGASVEVDGATLLALAGRLPLSVSVLREAKRFMRAVVQHHLGPRPLHSRSLFSADGAEPENEVPGRMGCG